MTRILAAAPALPAHRYDQSDITAALAELLDPSGEHRDLLERLHRATTVRTRHLSVPLPRYAELSGFTEANAVYRDVALDLAERACRDALDRAGVGPDEVDVVLSTTVTGVLVPSLEARLVTRLGLRPDVRRLPVFGLGCVAGAAGVARLHDHLRGDPDGVALLLSVELCSLTVQRDDPSTANLVASGLFGDGAAAVVLAGEDRARALGATGPQVVDSASRLYPDTEHVMGWDVGGSGFRIVLAPTVADVVTEHLGHDMAGFLGGHDLSVPDIVTWVCHPGGPKVIEAILTTLDLPTDALDLTWQSLAEVGNLSSSSVLDVLSRTLSGPPPAPGSHGVLMAMGPGFCSELVLLRWPDDGGVA